MLETQGIGNTQENRWRIIGDNLKFKNTGNSPYSNQTRQMLVAEVCAYICAVMK